MLSNKEKEFIVEMAQGFIGSYTNLKGNIVLDGEDDPEQIRKEIDICHGLINKFKN